MLLSSSSFCCIRKKRWAQPQAFSTMLVLRQGCCPSTVGASAAMQAFSSPMKSTIFCWGSSNLSMAPSYSRDAASVGSTLASPRRDLWGSVRGITYTETKVTTNPSQPILTAAVVWPRCYYSTVVEGYRSNAWPLCDAKEGMGTCKTR